LSVISNKGINDIIIEMKDLCGEPADKGDEQEENNQEEIT
jgi:hypothetical protein